MDNPVSKYIHFYIAKRLSHYRIKTVLDMGGNGRMENRGFDITNANSRYGIDATKLPFENNSFDSSVSIATLEHVGDHEKQKDFMKEAIRVSKGISIHWIPVHKDVELFLKKLGHNHSCIIPNCNLIFKELDLEYSSWTFTTIKEHLTFLATINPKLNIPKLHEYIYKHGHECYGELIEVFQNDRS